MSGASPSWSFILVAAGAGNRLGGIPKQFRRLGPVPVWMWSARVADRLFSRGMVGELVVVMPPGWDSYSENHGFRCPVTYAHGGETRSESVRNGLRAASSDYVMIHDAARPFLTEEVCEALIGATETERGAVPLLPSRDSLKEVDGGALRAISREKIYRTQTPQAFRRRSLLELLESEARGASDEAALWLEASRELSYVPGSERNFKITTDFDWAVATSLAARAKELRVGMGYDVHELVPGRRLVLGGVEIPSRLGLLGHSDADIICHALADALLGASGEGDIGTLFPASDGRYKDARSAALLERVVSVLVEKGWDLVWADITLVAQVPRLGEAMPGIADFLKAIIKARCPFSGLNVKVKSGEHVGSVGRAERMECYAAVTIERYEI
ncbi:MAG: 2-C-methyl-D-erythritol 2,4-cyclodiphosphate synthase [Synergistaceae bacterium]|jgi:2-C-methyl-D-erythritol 4-phosphate cytidylyltransferase/2-C-methyl-D-erythritol 2,4-cyclodiphosphate synthase|nr:2-C-methyl-D-erythritol 2,4-cyclodiphosphate synthase [Synergistaceae bacterium]